MSVKQDDSGRFLPVDPMVSMIERIVLDPNADLSKLERMLVMKERLDAEASRRAFSLAMSVCQAELEPIARNKANDQTTSRYADLSAIYQACKPVVGKHGFSFSTFPDRTEKPGHMAVRWILRHSGGHEEIGVAELPIDDKGIKGTVNKTGVHAFGSTASYARRYLFCMIFDVATRDDVDGNQKPRNTVSAEQFVILRGMIEETGTLEAKFHLAFGHRDPKNARLEEFPADRFEEARKMLQAKKDKMQ